MAKLVLCTRFKWQNSQKHGSEAAVQEPSPMPGDRQEHGAVSRLCDRPQQAVSLWRCGRCSNMGWQTTLDAKRKDRLERLGCN